RARARRRHLRDRARRVRRDPGSERLGQVDARPAALDAAFPGRGQRTHLRPRRPHRRARRPPRRQPRIGRGFLLQEDVGEREPRLCRPLLRAPAPRDERPHSGDPRAGRLPARPRVGADGEPLARDAAKGRARAGPPDVAGAPPPRRADDRARSALEARGAGLRARVAGAARHDDPSLHPRPRRGRDPGRARRDPRRGPVARTRHAGRDQGALRRRDARGRLLRGDGPCPRRADPRGGGMRALAAAARHELIGLSGVVERNWYLVKRYAWWELAFFVWTVANTLSIVFIAKGAEAAGATIDVNRLTTILLIGAVIWAYLGIIFEILTETVAWERWEGTIEYTFMAPLSRPVHLIGMGLFAVAYGVIRASLLFGVVAAMFGLHMPGAHFGTALVLLA